MKNRLFAYAEKASLHYPLGGSSLLRRKSINRGSQKVKTLNNSVSNGTSGFRTMDVLLDRWHTLNHKYHTRPNPLLLLTSFWVTQSTFSLWKDVSMVVWYTVPTVVTKEVDMSVTGPFLLTKPDFSKTVSSKSGWRRGVVTSKSRRPGFMCMYRFRGTHLQHE